MVKIFGFKISRVVERVFIVAFVIVITAVVVKATDNQASKNATSGLTDGCPEDMVFVPASSGGFCIDKYEASVGEDCPYQNPQNQQETMINLGFDECLVVSEKGKMPWRYISQDQAVLACAKMGKRLPTAKEWYLAALGTPDKNDLWDMNDCQVDKNWNEQPGLSGSGENCVSFAGAYDMIGNLWEWVDGVVEDSVLDDTILPEAGFISGMNSKGMPGEINEIDGNEAYNMDYFWIKNKGIRGIARGGYWANQSDAGQYSAYVIAEPSAVESGIGFRCVK